MAADCKTMNTELEKQSNDFCYLSQPASNFFLFYYLCLPFFHSFEFSLYVFT